MDDSTSEKPVSGQAEHTDIVLLAGDIATVNLLLEVLQSCLCRDEALGFVVVLAEEKGYGRL